MLTEAPNPLAMSKALYLIVMLYEALNLLAVSKVLYLNLLGGHRPPHLMASFCVMAT